LEVVVVFPTLCFQRTRRIFPVRSLSFPMHSSSFSSSYNILSKSLPFEPCLICHTMPATNVPPIPSQDVTRRHDIGALWWWGELRIQTPDKRTYKEYPSHDSVVSFLSCRLCTDVLCQDAQDTSTRVVKETWQILG